jgi:BirA family biotin operon repressor/biotin-[acetyl-CoA-carboxylase] ligase
MSPVDGPGAAGPERQPGPAGTRFAEIHRFATIDSTNRYLMDMARGGAPEGLVAVAAHQEAGRGRLGRRWEAPAGSNLLASVLLRLPSDASAGHLVPAAMALATADACRSACGVEVGVKWPNDLVDGEGRKLAGVLAEVDLDGPAAGAVVVGVGVNVTWPGPADRLAGDGTAVAPTPPVALSTIWARPTTPGALLEAVLVALEPRLAALADAAGRAGLAAELARRCVTVGPVVRVDLPGGSFEGRAVGLTGEGHLEVEVDGVRRPVVAGDVRHLRPVAGG